MVSLLSWFQWFYGFTGFVVIQILWFHWFHGFTSFVVSQVSWFRSFLVSLVSWFHRCHGFVVSLVSWFYVVFFFHQKCPIHDFFQKRCFIKLVDIVSLHACLPTRQNGVENRDKAYFLATRELTNRRLLHDTAVRLRDMLTAHAFLSTCQLRAKVDDVGENDLPASWKQEDVKLVFKVFSRYFGYFCQII